jgi:hypothetical protein
MNSRLCLATIAVITLILSTPVLAQQPGSITTGTSPRDRAIDDKYRSDEIERIKREAEQPERANPAPRFPAIKADFEQMQIINSDVLQTDAARQTPDYRQVAAAATEIKNRATRLKSNLFSLAAEKQSTEKGARTIEPQDIRSLLAALDDAIQTFVSNPMFTNLNIVDVQHSATARRDLDRIIKLSALIRKEADKLKKAAGG